MAFSKLSQKIDVNKAGIRTSVDVGIRVIIGTLIHQAFGTGQVLFSIFDCRLKLRHLQKGWCV